MATYIGLTPITISTEVVANPIAVQQPDIYDAIVISPDGATAYVATDTSGPSYSVVPIAIPSGVAGSPISLPQGPVVGMVITPDGTKLYLTTPAGSTPSDVTVVDLTTSTVTSIATGETNAYAVATNGTTTYVTDFPGIGNVIPIDVATATAGPPITGTETMHDIVMSSDGSTVWACGVALDGGNVVAITTATNVVAHSFGIFGGGSYGYAIAITPDGDTVFVIPDSGGAVYPIDVATSTVGAAVTFSLFGALGIVCNDATLFICHDADADLLTVDLVTSTLGSIDMGMASGSGGALGTKAQAITPDGTTLYVLSQAEVTVTSVTPANGPPAGGTSVTIDGLGFYRVTGAGGVKFGATDATSYSVITPKTQMGAVSPAGTGMVHVTVTGAWGVSDALSPDSDDFTYIAPAASPWVLGHIAFFLCCALARMIPSFRSRRR